MPGAVFEWLAINRSRDLLRWLLKEHVTEIRVSSWPSRLGDHFKLFGFDIDEDERL